MSWVPGAGTDCTSLMADRIWAASVEASARTVEFTLEGLSHGGSDHFIIMTIVRFRITQHYLHQMTLLPQASLFVQACKQHYSVDR